FNCYINGSYIDGPFPGDKKLFIATQGPLSNTVEHFWKMVINHNSKLILMLANVSEQGMSKCEFYWPRKIEQPLIFEKFRVDLENEEFVVKDSIIKRTVLITLNDKEEKMYVTQLHVIGWPDHSIPNEDIAPELMDFLIKSVHQARKE